MTSIVKRPESISIPTNADDVFYKLFKDSKSIDELADRIGEQIRAIGFSDYIYHTPEITFFRYFNSEPLQEIIEFYVLQQHQWNAIFEYIESNRLPVYLNTISNNIKAALYQTKRTSHQLEMINALSTSGYHDAYIIPYSHDSFLLVTTKDKHPPWFQQSVIGKQTDLLDLVMAVDRVVTDRFKN